MKFSAVIIYACLVALSIFFPAGLRAETPSVFETEERTFKIRGEVQAGYEYRDRDPHTGVYDPTGAAQGFNLRQTTLTIEKLFPDSGFLGRVRLQVMRNDEINTAGAGRSNPYLLFVRQAWLGYQLNNIFRTVIGIQEVPMDYSMIRQTWALNYVLVEPHESLKITESRSAAGVGIQGNWDHYINFNAMIANPEPEFQTHGTISNGYDVMARFSAVPTGRIGRFHFGFHFFYRLKNALAYSQSECLEGRSTCLKDDNNAATLLRIQASANRDRIFGSEFTFRLNAGEDSGAGFSAGSYWIENPGGRITDSLHPFDAPTYRPAADGNVIFAYFRTAFRGASIYYRIQSGTGNTGFLTATRTHRNIYSAYFDEKGMPRQFSDINYEDRSFFKKEIYGIEYRLAERWSISIGLENTRLYNNTGEEEKVYVDANGRQRSRTEFIQQFLPGGMSEGITPYRANAKQYFIRTSLVF